MMEERWRRIDPRRSGLFKAALAEDGASALSELLDQEVGEVGLEAGRLELILDGSPLTVRAAAGSPKCLELLLERGAKTSLGSAGGPAFAAVFHDRVDCLDVLLRHGLDLRERNQSGETALHMAARLGSVEVAKRLAGASPDWSARDGDDWTPVESALSAQARRGETLEIFERAGAPLGEALHWACAQGDAWSLAFLLDRGADPSKPNANGWSGLHLAVMEGQSLPCARLLIQAGADMDAKAGGSLLTASRMAAVAGLRDIFEALADAGADVDALDDLGRDCRQAALEAGQGAIVALLDEREMRMGLESAPKRAGPKGL